MIVVRRCVHLADRARRVGQLRALLRRRGRLGQLKLREPRFVTGYGAASPNTTMAASEVRRAGESWRRPIRLLLIFLGRWSGRIGPNALPWVVEFPTWHLVDRRFVSLFLLPVGQRLRRVPAHRKTYGGKRLAVRGSRQQRDDRRYHEGSHLDSPCVIRGCPSFCNWAKQAMGSAALAAGSSG